MVRSEPAPRDAQARSARYLTGAHGERNVKDHCGALLPLRYREVQHDDGSPVRFGEEGKTMRSWQTSPWKSSLLADVLVHEVNKCGTGAPEVAARGLLRELRIDPTPENFADALALVDLYTHGKHPL